MNFVQETVKQILDGVEREGVAKILSYTRQFDGIELDPGQILVSVDSLPVPAVPPAAKEAVDFACEQIRMFHQATKPETVISVDPVPGLHLEERLIPLQRVGLYVPNGQYPLISSLLMTAIPATVAGVENLSVAIAPKMPLDLDPLWIYALKATNVKTVLRVGGAQGVAAMAYGFEGFDPVELIAGPGNQFVAEAKNELFRRGIVGIDVIAGPSEVLVIAGDLTSPEIETAALDLLAQAEHAADTHAYFVSWSQKSVSMVQNRVQQWVKDYDGILGQIDWIFVSGPEEALKVAHRIAPEHLSLTGPEAEELAPRIKSAGALFVGRLAGQALGDYAAGPSHVLPTGGTGRFSGGLATRTFMRRMSVIAADDRLPDEYLNAGKVLASLEGLKFHEQSLKTRLQQKSSPRYQP
ncbi:MAG: histidinol dehydrogenase [Firmicutes bacterium]|nr:histidinol dehydrogenase [Bacillota bacterium]